MGCAHRARGVIAAKRSVFEFLMVKDSVKVLHPIVSLALAICRRIKNGIENGDRKNAFWPGQKMWSLCLLDQDLETRLKECDEVK